MTWPDAAQLAVLVAQAVVLAMMLRDRADARRHAEHEDHLYAQVVDLERHQRLTAPSPWAQATHLTAAPPPVDPIPPYGRHRPRHLQGEAR